MAEPFIQKAIDYDSGHAAKDALRKAAGLGVAPPGMELFSRGVHRTVGIGVGMILFGVAMGGLWPCISCRSSSDRPIPISQVILWSTVGLAFGALLEPMLRLASRAGFGRRGRPDSHHGLKTRRRSRDRCRQALRVSRIDHPGS